MTFLTDNSEQSLETGFAFFIFRERDNFVNRVRRLSALAPSGTSHKPIHQEGQRTTFSPSRLMLVAPKQGASAFHFPLSRAGVLQSIRRLTGASAFRRTNP